LPAKLNTIARLTPNAPNRILVQNIETNAAGQIVTAMLDGRKFHTPVQEFPQIGSTDLWQFTNITPLDHVKHVHLIQFQVLNRQPFDATRYAADWFAINGPPPFDHPTIRLAIEPYLTGPPVPPDPQDTIAWKDSVKVPAGMITRILVRWAPQDLPTGAGTPGVNQFPYDPFGKGYVWHCHLIEHEDNEMIRQLVTVPYTNYPDWMIGTTYNVGSKVRFGDKQYQALVANTASQANRPDIASTVWRVLNTAPSIITTPFPTCPVTPASPTPTATPTPTPTPTPGYCRLKNATTGMFIDGMGYTSNGSNACQWGNSGSTNQQWLLEVAGSYYKIKNRATGLYLDGMGRTSNGSICGQWSSSSSYNQQWTKEIMGSNVRYKNRATGLYLDGMGYTGNGSNLCQWGNSGSTNQQWQIVP